MDTGSLVQKFVGSHNLLSAIGEGLPHRKGEGDADRECAKSSAWHCNAPQNVTALHCPSSSRQAVPFLTKSWPLTFTLWVKLRQ